MLVSRIKGEVCARLSLGEVAALGFLASVATVFQIVVLAHIVDHVFLGGAGLAEVRRLLLLVLLGATLVRALLLCSQEVVAGRGAVRVSPALNGLQGLTTLKAFGREADEEERVAGGERGVPRAHAEGWQG